MNIEFSGRDGPGELGDGSAVIGNGSCSLLKAGSACLMWMEDNVCTVGQKKDGCCGVRRNMGP